MHRDDPRPDFTVLEATGPDQAETERPSAFRRAGSTVERAADWLADRIEDAGGWAANLVRYLPARIARLAKTLVAALAGIFTLLPSGVRIARRGGRQHVPPFLRAAARRGLVRTIQFVLEVLDLLGAPELFALFWRIATHTSPLTGEEIAAAAAVLGPRAMRYQDIRVAQGGVLRWIFAKNGQRAFATFHIINLPEQGDHQRSNVEIVVHEIVHVYQYERAGSRYLAEAILAQREEGYGYGGVEGLVDAVRKGKQIGNFNREQQAQIVQDYVAASRTRADISAYEPFIRQLRQGKV